MCKVVKINALTSTPEHVGHRDAKAGRPELTHSNNTMQTAVLIGLNPLLGLRPIQALCLMQTQNFNPIQLH